MCLHNLNICAQRPWFFGCRFVLAVTYNCLSPAAGAWTLICPLSAASVEHDVLSSEPPATREGRDPERQPGMRVDLDPPPPSPVPALPLHPKSKANSIPGA